MTFAYLRLAALPLIIATVSLASHSARAFTIDTQSSSSDSGNSRFADPDEQTQSSGRGVPIGQSGLSVQFGAQTPGSGSGFGFGSQGGLNSAPMRFGPRPPNSDDHD